MSVEKLKERKLLLDNEIQAQQKRIVDLKTQIDGAEATLRQWTDTILIVRGQMLEIDRLINELELPLPIEDEPKASKKGDKEQ
ncbi:MAG: hypothetical protein KKD44_28130 [Proteobacteria bacterium]|nr:hypothetical protein [Pseudomonadota bacterium]